MVRPYDRPGPGAGTVPQGAEPQRRFDAVGRDVTVGPGTHHRTSGRSEVPPGPPAAAQTSGGHEPRPEDVGIFDDGRFGGGPQRPGPPRSPDEAPAPPDDGGGRGPRHGGSGGRVRTLTGATAAAVVTVLSVVVAGQVADGEVSGGVVPDSGADRASQSVDDLAGDHGADSGAPTPGAVERQPDHAELMATAYDLDPKLTGSGELVPVPGSDPAAYPDAVSQLRYRVDVEAGLPGDPEFFADAVHRTLSDDRSWSNNGERGFTRVSSGDYDFVITLASPGTTAHWCDKSGLNVRVDNVSCDAATTERIMINAYRWAQGAETFGADMPGYRQMLINHEVGHRLGYGHALCPADGEPAPVMMQQTKFLTIGGLTCTPNGWPHPDN